MFLNQSHSAFAVRGHRLLEEKPVQTDGWTGRSSRDRHCGREHPHPSGQGQKHGECTHSMPRGVAAKLSGSPYQRVWTPVRTVGPCLHQFGPSRVIRKNHIVKNLRKLFASGHCHLFCLRFFLLYFFNKKNTHKNHYTIIKTN